MTFERFQGHETHRKDFQRERINRCKRERKGGRERGRERKMKRRKEGRQVGRKGKVRRKEKRNGEKNTETSNLRQTENYTSCLSSRRLLII